MANDNISNEIILTGRIYPAIQSCVNNRYKIILGFFTYYSFIFSSVTGRDLLSESPVRWAASILFTLFVILNSANYISNACEQIKKEQGKNECSAWELFRAADIEIAFLIISLIMIWVAHCTFSFPPK